MFESIWHHWEGKKEERAADLSSRGRDHSNHLKGDPTLPGSPKFEKDASARGGAQHEEEQASKLQNVESTQMDEISELENKMPKSKEEGRIEQVGRGSCCSGQAWLYPELPWGAPPEWDKAYMHGVNPNSQPPYEPKSPDLI
jgi:hypothetical protein